MKCQRCNGELLKTKQGKLCLECGATEGVAANVITSHDALVHSEHRLPDPTEPGEGQVDVITDMTAFTSESTSSLGAFTWIQVSVSRFSYYAAIFVLVFVMAGVGYNLIWSPTPVAEKSCNSSLADTSSGAANAQPSSQPTPTCSN
jgi:hypothetical protein